MCYTRECIPLPFFILHCGNAHSLYIDVGTKYYYCVANIIYSVQNRLFSILHWSHILQFSVTDTMRTMMKEHEM